MSKILFNEVQRFRQNPLWACSLLLPVAVFGSILAYQLITGKQVGDRPMSNTSLAVLSVLILSITLWALRSIKLTTIIDETSLIYGWNMPTNELNELALTDIREWSVIKYGFVGYGYRVSRKYGTVHNMSGNRGLQIITKKGEKILIGTHKLRELDQAMRKVKIGENMAASDALGDLQFPVG
jgi:hypothetical protein